MKAIRYFALLFLAMSLISCSSRDIGSSGGGAAPVSAPSTSVSAPSTLSGKTYHGTVESGSGVFGSTGTFTIVFSSSQPTYTMQGDGVNIRDSGGIYIYSSSGDSGTLKIFDSGVSKVAFLFTFNTAIAGTYASTTVADVNSRQSGTFTEQ